MPSLLHEDRLELPLEGSICSGEVKRIEPFGIFVEVLSDDHQSKFTGLVHISQLSQSRVESPHDIVAIGDRVYVKVLSITPSHDAGGKVKVSLSMKYCDQVPPVCVSVGLFFT